MHPGAAAVVGGDTISTGQVDDVALSLCAANSGGQSGLPTRQARQGALSVLLQTQLALQLGRKEGVRANQQQLAAAVAQSGSTIRKLPPERRPAFRDALTRYVEAQLMLREAGRKVLEARGPGTVTAQRAQAAGTALLRRYADRADISVDPRFGRFTNGALQAASGSLSVPVSSRASDGSSSDPSASWVAGLPANQKCS